MTNEPTIFCPKCGEKATVIEWFEFDPGKGLGYAECPNCGTLDFKIRNGNIISALQPEPEKEESDEAWLMDLAEYDREIEDFYLSEELA